MRLSKYILDQSTGKSRCPECDTFMGLISHQIVNKWPTFFICWSCRKMWQVGVGPVPLGDGTVPAPFTAEQAQQYWQEIELDKEQP